MTTDKTPERRCEVSYEFWLSSNGSYATSRNLCLNDGADLMHENFGNNNNGKRYHESVFCDLKFKTLNLKFFFLTSLA